VNPAHLYLGTSKHKAEDKVRGEKNGRAKLTESQVREIKQQLARGERVYYGDYGVSRKTIFNIKHGYRWQHVEG
jgi:ABC-type Fe3+-citrate transport system substrate-binding protein